jgi:basic membrane lipoprotein Med (substrate-binding protein (PBP1-ABC) superfamily)
VAPTPPIAAYIAVLPSHCRYEPSSLLLTTSFRFDHSTNGWANQNPNVAFTLVAVLVEETKIHQMGTKVNKVKSPQAKVARFIVRRRRP